MNIAAAIVKARKPFVKGTFVAGQTVSVGGNTTMLMRPVDEVIAYTQVGLHRSNFVTERGGVRPNVAGSGLAS